MDGGTEPIWNPSQFLIGTSRKSYRTKRVTMKFRKMLLLAWWYNNAVGRSVVVQEGCFGSNSQRNLDCTPSSDQALLIHCGDPVPPVHHLFLVLYVNGTISDKPPQSCRVAHYFAIPIN